MFTNCPIDVDEEIASNFVSVPLKIMENLVKILIYIYTQFYCKNTSQLIVLKRRLFNHLSSKQHVEICLQNNHLLTIEIA